MGLGSVSFCMTTVCVTVCMLVLVFVVIGFLLLLVRKPACLCGRERESAYVCVHLSVILDDYRLRGCKYEMLFSFQCL